jgi:hypothetical protein
VSRRLHFYPVFLFFWLLPALNASTLFFGGNLRTDATVTSCGAGCTLTVSDSDAAWAQFAAAVYFFSVPAPSTMYAVTFGYGGGTSGTGVVVPAGGFEPYLSLFDSGGNFMASTRSGVYCPPGANTVPGGAFGGCDDVLLNGGTLTSGTYQIAISAWENMSFAENLGTGTVAAGFTGLGNLATGENLNYAFDVVLTPEQAAVPEPESMALTALGAAFLLLRRFWAPFGTASLGEKE